MENPHLFRASKCGKTDRVLILNSKRKTAQNRTVEPFSTGRGRRAWSRLPARSVLLHTLYAEVSAGDPHPSTLSECLVFIFCTYKKQQTPQKRCLLFWQGQKGSNPRHSVLETDALPAELYPYNKKMLVMVDHHGLEPRTDRL